MKVLHVDDHPLFSSGLVAALGAYVPGIEIISASDTEKANQILLDQPEIDLILLDMHMPDVNGIAFMRALSEQRIYTPVAIFSADEDVRQIQKALSMGAIGFIPKYWDHEKISQALLAMELGEVVVPDHIQMGIAQLVKSPNGERDGLDISTRQLEVLGLMSEGLTNKDIAKILMIGESTVKTHVKALFQIFNCKTRIDCVRKAQSKNLI